MRFRKPTVEPLEINLTPMIDCLLFLIVFLLMATTFNHFSRINIVLPEAEGVAVTNEGKQIEVAVQKDGTYLVNGLALGSSTEAELINMLQKKRAVTANNCLSSQPMPKHHTKRWCVSWMWQVKWAF